MNPPRGEGEGELSIGLLQDTGSDFSQEEQAREDR